MLSCVCQNKSRQTTPSRPVPCNQRGLKVFKIKVGDHHNGQNKTSSVATLICRGQPERIKSNRSFAAVHTNTGGVRLFLNTVRQTAPRKHKPRACQSSHDEKRWRCHQARALRTEKNRAEVPYWKGGSDGYESSIKRVCLPFTNLVYSFLSGSDHVHAFDRCGSLLPCSWTVYSKMI